MTARRSILVLCGLLLAGLTAQAQDAPPPTDSSAPDTTQQGADQDAQLNRELDETLEREYADPDRPRSRRSLPPVDPDRDPPSSRRDRRERDDGFRIRLRAFGGHYAATFRDVQIGYREGLQGGDLVDLDDNLARFGFSHTQLYGGEISLGRWIGLWGGYHEVHHRYQKLNPTEFGFGRAPFAENDIVQTSLEFRTADLDLVVKPLHTQHATIGLHFGARYMLFDSELRSALDGQSERSRIESTVPMVGLELRLRPVRFLEAFVLGRIGHFEYERDEAYVRRRNGSVDRYEAKTRSATAAELNAGLSFTLFDTVGLLVGYRLDYFEMERVVDARAERAEGFAHGPYAALMLQF